jgi:ATP-dependent protease Clp ATPase subunit
VNETKKITSVVRCSFCRKRKSEVRLLIAGPTDSATGMAVCICDKCVAGARAIAATEGEEQVHQLSTQPMKE